MEKTEVTKENREIKKQLEELHYGLLALRDRANCLAERLVPVRRMTDICDGPLLESVEPLRSEIAQNIVEKQEIVKSVNNSIDYILETLEV